ncbi:MAG: hypothetical protein J4452_00920 [Candidatus Aenigmarchaeota archaeon]|nr:hypothetical protein [Candidatus Aenigmarchaeota archaeon]
MGTESRIYLGKSDDPKPDRVKLALGYLEGRIRNMEGKIGEYQEQERVLNRLLRTAESRERRKLRSLNSSQLGKEIDEHRGYLSKLEKEKKRRTRG